MKKEKEEIEKARKEYLKNEPTAENLKKLVKKDILKFEEAKFEVSGELEHIASLLL